MSQEQDLNPEVKDSPEPSAQMDAQGYINAIKNLRENTVSRADYDALKAENKKLINAIAAGETVEKPQQTPVDINKLRKELFDPEADYSNLEYARRAVELRDALIADGKPDPFLPNGEKIAPTTEDEAKADRVAAAFKSCIEYADGDSALFTQELQRITRDSAPARRK